MDTNLNWKKHIEKVANRCSKKIGVLNLPVPVRSHVKKLEVTEMKMCRWTYHTLRYHVRKDNIRERLKV